MDTKTVRLKRSFIFGYIALLLCGVGNWLIGYEPKGGEPLMFGISNTSIAQVPTWFYVLSLLFGILSGFGCWKFAPAILEALKDKGISESSKMYKTMKFGLVSAPMMFVSISTLQTAIFLSLRHVQNPGDTHLCAWHFTLPSKTAKRSLNDLEE